MCPTRVPSIKYVKSIENYPGPRVIGAGDGHARARGSLACIADYALWNVPDRVGARADRDGKANR